MTAVPSLVIASLLVSIGLFGAVRRRTLPGAVTGVQVAVVGTVIGLAGVAQFAQGTGTHPADLPESAAMLGLVGVALVLAETLAALGLGLLLARRQGGTLIDSEERGETRRVP